MQQARGRSQTFIECLPSTTSFNIYNLLWGTGSPTLQRPNGGLERFNPLLKAIQTVYNRAWVGALTCLTEELIFFCLHCTANFPLVTSSVLVRSELMRFIVLPKNWLYLRTGGWRQGHLHNVCLNCLQFIKDKVTKTDPNVGQSYYHSSPLQMALTWHSPTLAVQWSTSLLLVAPNAIPSLSTIPLHSFNALTQLARLVRLMR